MTNERNSVSRFCLRSRNRLQQRQLPVQTQNTQDARHNMIRRGRRLLFVFSLAWPGRARLMMMVAQVGRLGCPHGPSCDEMAGIQRSSAMAEVGGCHPGPLILIPILGPEHLLGNDAVFFFGRPNENVECALYVKGFDRSKLISNGRQKRKWTKL